MTFHEDYARNKANEAIKTGLNSQKDHRTLSESRRNTVNRKKLLTTGIFILIAICMVAGAFASG